MIKLDNLCIQCMKDKGNSEICPNCSYNGDDNQKAPYLPPKTRLQGKYFVGKMLSCNGEGATYIGFDITTNSTVMIREFLPANLCERNTTTWAISALGGCEEAFDRIKAEFLDMARKLARMRELDALFPIFDIFELGGTAYYVSEYIESISLNNFLLRNGGHLTFEQCRIIMMPVLNSLISLHEADILHMGISPDTILMGRDGKLRLSGFCVTDERISRNDLNCELFDGYAAIEQYGFEGQHGTWTDVYSFSSVLYRVLVGNAPPEARKRVNNDRLSIPASIANKIPSYALSALANGLQFLPEDRIQTAEQFRDDFSIAPIANKEVSEDPIEDEKEPEVIAPVQKKKKKYSYRNRSIMYTAIALVCTIAILATIGFFVGSKFIFGNDDDSSSLVSLAPTSSTSVSSAFDYTGLDAVTLPDFVGKAYSQVFNEFSGLAPYNFEIEKKEYSDKYEAGVIISQSQKAGSKISRTNSSPVTVKLVVSLGKNVTVMPDLSDYTYEEAFVELAKLGVPAYCIEKLEKYSDSYSANHVISTSPEADTTFSVDQKITLYVSDDSGSIENNSTSSQEEYTEEESTYTEDEENTETEDDTESYEE